jgi:hypothetical protein
MWNSNHNCNHLFSCILYLDVKRHHYYHCLHICSSSYALNCFLLFIAHGTFIGSLRLESHKPTQLPIDSTFHFGASTRYYIIRERPQTGARPIIEELEKTSEEAEGGLLGLPETETELDVSWLHTYLIPWFKFCSLAVRSPWVSVLSAY